jgi:hypothetical protein
MHTYDRTTFFGRDGQALGADGDENAPRPLSVAIKATNEMVQSAIVLEDEKAFHYELEKIELEKKQEAERDKEAIAQV